ncbi:MAG: hypothetical protein U1F98_03025 [Verrucomicrobiota bacterium]
MKLKHLTWMTGLACALAVTTPTAWAQDGGGPGGPGGGRPRFDPAQMQQMRLDRLHEQMDVKDDAEWNIIQARATKVMDAQREVMSSMFRGFGGRRGGDNNGGGQGGGRGGFFGQPNPDLEALQKAIESNAPTEQVKAALEKYRASRKAKEAALAQAQAELQKVLTTKQEAVAVANGLLN